MDADSRPLQLTIRCSQTARGVSVLGWKRELRFDSVATLNSFFRQIGRGESFGEHDLIVNGAKNIQGMMSTSRLQQAEALFSCSEVVFREQRRFIAAMIESLQSQSPGIEIITQSQPWSFKIDFDAQHCFVYLSSPVDGIERKLSIQFNDSLQSLHLTPVSIHEEDVRWHVAPSNSTLGALLDADAKLLAARVKSEFGVNLVNLSKNFQ